jgi:hypothetical protein
MAKESDPAPDSEDSDTAELSPEIADEAERLTKLARDVGDDAEADAYREARSDLLADTEFTARVREDDRDTLVLYPEAWVVDGTVHPDRIDDIDRGIERPLEGPGASEDWDVIDDHNRAIAEHVAEKHDDVHGQNAQALADFASNHYAKPIDDLTREEREEFLSEYFVRNAFPSDDQKAAVEESVQVVLDVADDESTGALR